MNELRAEVAATARMLARAGLLEAFGHVSARTTGGMLITSTQPLAEATADDVIVFEDGRAVGGPVDHTPLEVPMHAAVYEARADVHAICRGHPPAAVAWGVGTDDVPLLHGLGGMAGERVRVHPDIRLIKDAESGSAVAATLGGDTCVVLRANGALAVGPTLIEAATSLWYLDERAGVALAAPEDVVPAEASVWQERLGDSAAEMRRATAWFTATFGEENGSA